MIGIGISIAQVAVRARHPTFTLTGTPPASATVGVPYSFTPTVSGTPAPTAFVLIGTLPAGLSFSTTTGAITGTPTTAGTTTGLNMRDGSGLVALGGFSITVAAAAAGMPAGRVADWDAATIPVVADGTAVSAWTDSINGLVATPTAGAPAYKTNRIGATRPTVQFAGSSYLTATLAGSALKTALDSQNYTILIVMQNIVAVTFGTVLSTTNTSSGSTNLLLCADGALLGRDAGASGAKTGITAPYTGSSLVSLCYSGGTTHPFNGSTESIQKLALNGLVVMQQQATIASSAPPVSKDDLYIGASAINAAATGFKGEIARIIVWNRELTQPEIMRAEMAVRDSLGIAYPWASVPYIYAVDGDSIHRGTFSSAGAYTFPAIMATTLGLAYGQWCSIALPSQNIDSMAANAAIDLDPIVALSGKPLRLATGEWYNQHVNAGSTAAQCLTKIQSYTAARRAALGAASKIVLVTPTANSTDDVESPTPDASRQAYIAGIVANYASWGADGVARADLNANIGASGSDASSTYFHTDHLHLSGLSGASGYRELAGVVAPVLSSV